MAEIPDPDEREQVQQLAAAQAVADQDLLQQVLSAATAQAIIGTDVQGMVTIFNRGAERLLGYSADEMIGTDRWRDLHDPAELPSVLRHFVPGPDPQPKDLRLDVGGMDEWTFICKDRRRLRATVSVTPMQDHQGQLSGYLVIATDVTRARELEAAQAQARAELEEAQQLAEVGSFTLDMSTQQAVWSPQMYRIFGMDPAASAPGTDSWLDFIPAADRPATEALIQAALERGESYEFDHEIVARDGVVRMVRERGRMVLDDEGRPIRLHGTSQDITQARRAEHELLEARDLFQQLLEAATDQAIIGTDRNHRISIFNRGAELMLGYSAAEMMGTQDWRRLHDPDELPLLVDADAENLGLEDAWPRIEAVFRSRPEWAYVRKDGQRLRAQVSMHAMRDHHGTMTGMLSVVTDVTEVRRIEREVVEAQDLFEQVLSAATDQAILSVDTAGRLTLFNKGAERMLGYTADEVLGRSPWSVLKSQEYLSAIGADEETVDAAYLDSLARREPDGQTRRPALPGDDLEDLDREWLCKNGDVVTVLTNVTPMRDHEGSLSGYLCIATDVTEQRETERARDRAEREVQAAMQEISDARDEALAANQAKSAFLATMSHEIRTPMNAVIGMTGLLLDTELDDEQRDLLETVRGSGDQLLAIINDILDFSKIEAGDLELESVAFDLRDVVEGTVAQFASSAKGIDLLSHIDDTCPVSVIGDPTRLRQVLSNLISNAIKFTAAGDVLVHVTSPEQDGDQVNLMFQVRDTGIGIPEQSMHRLFKSFSQVDASTTRTYGGTGLGLAISRALVTAMGGDIWVESAVGEGSTFSFTAQLRHDAEGPAAKVGSLDALTLRAALAGRRVLVVDDNENNRRILSMQLASYSADAVEASGAVEALNLVAQEPEHFDLAVLDLVMPVLDGVQLAGAIKRIPGREQVPVILLSSLGRKLHPDEEGLFATVLTKPVRSVPLMEAFARAMGAAPAPAPGVTSDENPAVPAGAGIPAQAGPRGPEATASSEPEPPALRILLAEDNEVNQKVGRLMLGKLGYQADIVGNGELALDAIRSKDYDLVLMDMHMPVMDGLEATRRIRDELSAARQPIIVAMTASVTMEDREACTEAGMNDYLSKPVRPEALAAVLDDAAGVRRAGG